MRGDTRGPREDDQRKRRTEPLVQGEPIEGRTDRRLEEDTEDLEPGRRPLTTEPAGTQPSLDEVNRRSDFATWLRPSGFPADRDELVRTASEEGAPGWVIDRLEGLDGARRFATAGEVWEATGGG